MWAYVAAVAGESYPVQWNGRQAVVALGEHIDVSNAGQLSEQLLLLVNRGAAELIVDMSATVSCDYAGADAVVRAYQRAAANGTQLRLVVAAAMVRRVLAVNGLDRLIPVWAPSTDENDVAAFIASAHQTLQTLAALSQTAPRPWRPPRRARGLWARAATPSRTTRPHERR